MGNRTQSTPAEPVENGGFRPAGDAARDLLLTLQLSGFAFEPQPGRAAPHGGAHNRADRTSDGLTLYQCQRIVTAAFRAVANGTAFNRFVTIHWELAGVPDARGAWATGRFVKLASDWLATRGARFAWAWVRETGEGKGSHVHILMYVPPELARAFARRQRRWLKRITGKPYRRGVIKTERIGGTLRAFLTVPEHYRVNLGALLAYVLKGALPNVAASIGLKRIEPAGRVTGKRAACSQNLGSAAKMVMR